MTFDDLVKLNTLNFMSSVNSLVLPRDLQYLLLPKNLNKFHRIKLRTDTKFGCLSNLIPKLWNELKNDRFINTSHIFMSTIKRKTILNYD